MSQLAKNLREAMKRAGITQVDLGERAGISQVMIHKLLSGKSSNTTKIFALAKALQCSPEWLLYGAKTSGEAKEPSSEYIGGLVEWDEKTPLEGDQVELPYYTNVELSAGNGSSLCEEHSDRKLRFSKITLKRQGVDPSHASCVRVCGDSMSPLLPDGATVGVDTATTKVVDGKMYAIEHEGMLRIKTLYNVPGGGLRLRSFNEAEYPDEIYKGSDSKSVKVLGKVFWYSVLL